MGRKKRLIVKRTGRVRGKAKTGARGLALY